MTRKSFKFFLLVSAAAHAAILAAWLPPEPVAGKTGKVLELAVINLAGDTTMQYAAVSAGVTAVSNQPHTTPPDLTHQGKQPSVPKKRQTAPHPVPAGKQDTISGEPEEILAGSTTDSRENARNNLRACVLELITRKLAYPVIARRKGWQGTVKLGLHIEPDGQITGLHIKKTSGYAILDEATINSLQLASVPDAEQWLNGSAIDIVVPVKYRLIDS